jgi:hypothetical protein
VLAATASPALSRRAEAIATVLLDHHRRNARRAHATDDRSSLINTDRLCARAGMPDHAGSIAVSLMEVAQWCADRRWPPLNALAVHRQTGKPGGYYRLAAGCSVLGWRDEMRACLAFDGYPATQEARGLVRRLAVWMAPQRRAP